MATPSFTCVARAVVRVRRVLVALLLTVGTLARAETFPIELATHPVPIAEGIQLGDRIGRLRFLGMLELPILKLAETRFSQLSGLAWDDDEQILYAISDKGWLFHLRPKFQGEYLHGVTLLDAVPMREQDTNKPLKRQRSDQEGLDVVNARNGIRGDSELVVSFERVPRVMRYRPNGKAVREDPLPEVLRSASGYRSDNKALEAACVDDKYGTLVAPEVPRKDAPEGETRIYGLSGDSWLYRPEPDYRITAMECLGNAELLVLEVDYGRLLAHSALALKRVQLSPPSARNARARVTQIVRLDTAQGYVIDNFEGLARHRGMRFFLVTDNNDLFFQRTLLVYIELLPVE